MGVSPSRDLGLPVPQEGESAQGVLTAAYDALRRTRWLRRPSAAAWATSWRTLWTILWSRSASFILFRSAKSGFRSRPAPYDLQPYPAEFVPGQEIGWQDAITVTVTYQMALLPVAGRLLSVGNANITTDGAQGPASQGMQVYKYQLSASATLGNEGEKSVAPYLYKN